MKNNTKEEQTIPLLIFILLRSNAIRFIESNRGFTSDIILSFLGVLNIIMLRCKCPKTNFLRISLEKQAIVLAT